MNFEPAGKSGEVVGKTRVLLGRVPHAVTRYIDQASVVILKVGLETTRQGRVATPAILSEGHTDLKLERFLLCSLSEPDTLFHAHDRIEQHSEDAICKDGDRGHHFT